MKAAFVLFDQLTALDFVGVYDAVTRLRSMEILPDFAFDICARIETVADNRGLRLHATRVSQSLAEYDLMIVAGGYVTRELQRDESFMNWFRTAAPVPLKASVCTGSLLLGAAGFLKGLSATSHPTTFDELAAYCTVNRTDRVVDAGAVVTGRGVTAGIDLGLHLVERLAGAAARQRVAEQMDYPFFTPIGRTA